MIFGIALLFVFGIVAVLKFIVTYWGHKLGTNIERDMRNDVKQGFNVDLKAFSV